MGRCLNNHHGSLNDGSQSEADENLRADLQTLTAAARDKKADASPHGAEQGHQHHLRLVMAGYLGRDACPHGTLS